MQFRTHTKYGLVQAYAAGWQACQAQQPRDTCPYCGDASQRQRTAWMRGYNEAFKTMSFTFTIEKGNQ